MRIIVLPILLMLGACGSTGTTVVQKTSVPFTPQEVVYPPHYTVADCKRLRKWSDRHHCRVYFGKRW